MNRLRRPPFLAGVLSWPLEVIQVAAVELDIALGRTPLPPRDPRPLGAERCRASSVPAAPILPRQREWWPVVGSWDNRRPTP